MLSVPVFTSLVALLACFAPNSVAAQQYGLSNTADTYHRLESYPHALKMPFLDKYLSSRFYDYGGDTLIKSDSFIRLTGDRAGEAGWLFSKLPAMPESFQIEFDFKIHGHGTTLYGDGLALWITSHKGELGPVFGSKDKFQGLGLFFDTYKNNRPNKAFPYVMAMMGDGNTEYDRANDGLANELAGCSARGLHNPRDISHARLTYVKGKFMSLDLDYKTPDAEPRQWTNCFVLEGEKAQLPSTGLFLGFSARTGQLTENHDIHRVQVYSLRNPPQTYSDLRDHDAGMYTVANAGNSGSSNGKRLYSQKSQSKGSWLGFFGKALGVVAVIIVLVFAYGLYLTKVKDKREKANRDAYYMSY
ncbi:uncharacterized protein SAPINGB_P000052 [Magnusiomyces paraingens]|uniref:L-type lectin-like domain-containing protein n=1 Tax=Magnusiomyces paraingens TaxID=2606893 RepID=A0A5E8AWP6_9ASCO|nr:uncharacterized protein SAPINGB_P000052 [Saprochaete ingens]VVT43591.1 unnamed protein product [Saprochaete ingens]